jgi:hypothetical protein
MERFDDDYNIIPLEDEEGNKIILNKPIDLWNYLQKTIFSKDLEK